MGQALMNHRFFLVVLAGAMLLATVGCEPPAPKISNNQAETHQKEKDDRDGHYNRSKN
jgi:hypothetical protein